MHLCVLLIWYACFFVIVSIVDMKWSLTSIFQLKGSFHISEQTNLLEHLHLITRNSKIIFSPENHDSEFIASLTHWLIVVGLKSNVKKLNRISFSEEFNIEMDQSYDQHPNCMY